MFIIVGRCCIVLLRCWKGVVCSLLMRLWSRRGCLFLLWLCRLMRLLIFGFGMWVGVISMFRLLVMLIWFWVCILIFLFWS